MTLAEFHSWQRYYAETPFDDHYRYHRPAVLVAQAMAGGKAQDKLDFLVPPQTWGAAEHVGYSSADLNTLAALGLKPPARD